MKPPPLRLRWRVMISYVPLLITPIIVMALVTVRVAEQGLGVLVTNEAERQAYALVNIYAAFYQQHGSWDGAESLRTIGQNIPADAPPETSAGDVADPVRSTPANPANQPPPSARLPPRFRANPPPLPEAVLITDTHGVIVWDETSGVKASLKGQTLSADALSHGAPIYVANQWIGTLVLGSALDDTQQRGLLNTLTAALILSGLISALLSIILGLWLSNQISAPIQQLMRGVQGLRGAVVTTAARPRLERTGDADRRLQHDGEGDHASAAATAPDGRGYCPRFADAVELRAGQPALSIPRIPSRWKFPPRCRRFPSIRIE
jgi:hypothetical protein